MKKPTLLASLLAVLILMAFTSSRLAVTPTAAPAPAKAVTDLSAFFRKDLAPLKAAQVETINAAAFEAWLRQTSMPSAHQKAVQQYLQPVLKTGKLEGFLIKKATVQNKKYVSDVVVVRVPKAVRTALKGVAYVTIYSDTGKPSAPLIESCQYNDCYCSSKNTPGLCTTATQFNKTCPPNECAVPQGTCDCGGGEDGGGKNLYDAFETVYH